MVEGGAEEAAAAGSGNHSSAASIPSMAGSSGTTRRCSCTISTKIRYRRTKRLASDDIVDDREDRCEVERFADDGHSEVAQQRGDLAIASHVGGSHVGAGDEHEIVHHGGLRLRRDGAQHVERLHAIGRFLDTTAAVIVTQRQAEKRTKRGSLSTSK